MSILAAGCVAPGVNMLPALDASTAIEPEKGLVIARIVNASGWPLPFNHLTIAPQNLNESEEILSDRLLALDEIEGGSTVFASPVNAGSYSLGSLRSFHTRGEYWYDRWANTDPEFGTFEVAAGRVTDLGTLIYYEKSQGDRLIRSVVRAPSNNQGALLSEYFPFYNFDSNQVLTWNEDEFDDERNTTYASIVQNPLVYNHKYQAPDNSIFLIGKLGTLIERNADGQWLMDAVDTNLDLFAIAKNQNGDLVVGGAEGRIFVKLNGNNWEARFLDSSHLIEELFFDQDNNIIVISRQNNKINVLRLELFDRQAAAQEVIIFDTVSGWKTPAERAAFAQLPVNDIREKRETLRHFSAVWITNFNDQTYIGMNSSPPGKGAMPGWTKRHYFSIDKSNWTFTEIKDNEGVDGVVSAGKKQLGINTPGIWSWSGRSSYYLYDKNLKKWKNLPTKFYNCSPEDRKTSSHCISPANEKKRKVFTSFTFASAPVFFNENEGIALLNYRDRKTKNDETKLFTTTNSGLDWQPSANALPAKYCFRLIPEIYDRLVLSCFGSSGDVYEVYRPRDDLGARASARRFLKNNRKD